MTLLIISIFALTSLIVVSVLTVWYADSGFRIVLTPLILILTFFFLRVIPGPIFAIATGLTSSGILWLYGGAFVGLLAGYSLFYLGLTSMRRPLYHLHFREFNVTQRHFMTCVICLVFLVLVGLFHYQGSPPMFSVMLKSLTSGYDSASVMEMSGIRQQLTKGHYFGTQPYRGQGITSALLWGWSILTGVCFVGYFKTRKRKWFILLAFVFLGTFAFLTGDGTRGPFLNAVILWLIMFSVMFQLKFRHLALVFAVIFFLAISISLFSPKLGGRYLSSDREHSIVTEGVQRITSRILIGNSINDVHAYNFIKQGYFDYEIAEMHTRMFYNAIPGKRVIPFSHELFTLMYPGRATRGSTTYASGTYITPLFLDFGYTGTFLAFIAIGGVAGWMGWARHPVDHRAPFAPIFYAQFYFFTYSLLLSGITAFLVQLLMFGVMVIVWVLSSYMAHLFSVHRPGAVRYLGVDSPVRR